MPMTGYIEVDQSGIYVRTLERRVDTTSISLDPTDNAALIKGEWLTLNAANEFIRPTNNLGVINPDNKTFRPVLRGAGLLDVQAAQGPVTALDEVGAVIRTDMYGTNGGAITYTFDDDLVVALIYDKNGNLKSGLVPAGTTTVATTDEGDVAAVGTQVVARVVRPPFTLTGTGTDLRKLVMSVRIL